MSSKNGLALSELENSTVLQRAMLTFVSGLILTYLLWLVSLCNVLAKRDYVLRLANGMANPSVVCLSVVYDVRAPLHPTHGV